MKNARCDAPGIFYCGFAAQATWLDAYGASVKFRLTLPPFRSSSADCVT
jgi:hypothetical protein